MEHVTSSSSREREEPVAAVADDTQAEVNPPDLRALKAQNAKTKLVIEEMLKSLWEQLERSSIEGKRYAEQAEKLATMNEKMVEENKELEDKARELEDEASQLEKEHDEKQVKVNELKAVIADLEKEHRALKDEHAKIIKKEEQHQQELKRKKEEVENEVQKRATLKEDINAFLYHIMMQLVSEIPNTAHRTTVTGMLNIFVKEGRVLEGLEECLAEGHEPTEEFILKAKEAAGWVDGDQFKVPPLPVTERQRGGRHGHHDGRRGPHDRGFQRGPRDGGRAGRRDGGQRRDGGDPRRDAGRRDYASRRPHDSYDRRPHDDRHDRRPHEGRRPHDDDRRAFDDRRPVDDRRPLDDRRPPMDDRIRIVGGSGSRKGGYPQGHRGSTGRLPPRGSQRVRSPPRDPRREGPPPKRPRGGSLGGYDRRR